MSGIHVWNGAAPNLNSKPIFNITQDSSNPEVLNPKTKSKVPVWAYTKVTPNRIRPEDRAPNIKYFNPDSVDLTDLLSLTTRT